MRSNEVHGGPKIHAIHITHTMQNHTVARGLHNLLLTSKNGRFLGLFHPVSKKTKEAMKKLVETSTAGTDCSVQAAETRACLQDKTQLLAQLETTKQDLNSARAMTRHCRESLVVLQDQLRERQFEVQRAQNELRAAQEQARVADAALQHRVQETEARLVHAQQARDQFAADLERVQNESAAHAANVEQAQLATQAGAVAHADAHAQLRARITEQEAAREALQVQLMQAHEAAAVHAGRAVQATQAEAEAVRERARADLVLKTQELQAAREAVTECQASAAAMRQQLQQAQEERDGLQDSLNDLRQEFGQEIDIKQGQIADLEHDLQDKDEELRREKDVMIQDRLALAREFSNFYRNEQSKNGEIRVLQDMVQSQNRLIEEQTEHFRREIEEANQQTQAATQRANACQADVARTRAELLIKEQEVTSLLRRPRAGSVLHAAGTAMGEGANTFRQPLRAYIASDRAPTYDTDSATDSPIYASAESPIYASAESPIYASGESPIYASAESPIYASGESPIYASGESPTYSSGSESGSLAAGRVLPASVPFQTDMLEQQLFGK